MFYGQKCTETPKEENQGSRTLSLHWFCVWGKIWRPKEVHRTGRSDMQQLLKNNPLQVSEDKNKELWVTSVYKLRLVTTVNTSVYKLWVMRHSRKDKYQCGLESTSRNCQHTITLPQRKKDKKRWSKSRKKPSRKGRTVFNSVTAGIRGTNRAFPRLGFVLVH